MHAYESRSLRRGTNGFHRIARIAKTDVAIVSGILVGTSGLSAGSASKEPGNAPRPLSAPPSRTFSRIMQIRLHQGYPSPRSLALRRPWVARTPLLPSPESSFLFASPRRSYGRCASRARSAVSRRISKNQYTRVRRREKGPRSEKKKRRKEKTYSISRLPRRSSPCLPLFFSPGYRLSRLSFRFSPFFSHYPPARRIARNLSLLLSRSRSFVIRRCEGAIEKRRKDRSVSTKGISSRHKSEIARARWKRGRVYFLRSAPRALWYSLCRPSHPRWPPE